MSERNSDKSCNASDELSLCIAWIVWFIWKFAVAINDDIAVLSCDSVWAGWGGTVAKTGGKDTR